MQGQPGRLPFLLALPHGLCEQPPLPALPQGGAQGLRVVCGAHCEVELTLVWWAERQNEVPPGVHVGEKDLRSDSFPVVLGLGGHVLTGAQVALPACKAWPSQCVQPGGAQCSGSIMPRHCVWFRDIFDTLRLYILKSFFFFLSQVAIFELKITFGLFC